MYPKASAALLWRQSSLYPTSANLLLLVFVYLVVGDIAG
jgi:hypothetical protein